MNPSASPLPQTRYRLPYQTLLSAGGRSSPLEHRTEVYRSIKY